MKSQLKTSVFFALLVVIIATSCIEDEPINTPNTFDPKEQARLDDSIIIAYITENNIEAIKDTTGIYYTITKLGDGEFPKSNSTVIVNYKGYLTNGSVFDQTTDQPRTFALNTLILGWQIGIPFLSNGGSEILLLPSAYGYGQYKVGTIPANSVLIFEIDLVDFY